MSAAYYILLFCRLREVKLLGLKWEDIDLDGRRLSIRRTLQRLKTDGGIVVVVPKSISGRGQIVLAPPVVEALKRWRVRQMEERWQPSVGYVFSSKHGTPTGPRNLYRTFTGRATELGLPKIRVHDFRHTCATLLTFARRASQHPKIVHELLGHSQISLTMDTYSHVLLTMQERAARTLERVLGAK